MCVEIHVTFLDTVFNLPNNVEVLMEVSSESNIDAGASNEQNAAGNENNNNARKSTSSCVTRRVFCDGKRDNAYLFDIFRFAGRTNVFPFGTPPPPYFMRNFMQAVAGHMVHSGITTTTISTRNPPATTVGAQQGISSSMDSGSTNAGQSTQARYITLSMIFALNINAMKLFYSLYNIFLYFEFWIHSLTY